MPYKIKKRVKVDSYTSENLAQASDNASQHNVQSASELESFIHELQSVLKNATYRVSPRASNVSFQTQVRSAVSTALQAQSLDSHDDWMPQFMMRSEQGAGGWGENSMQAFFKFSRGNEVYQDSGRYVFFNFALKSY